MGTGQKHGRRAVWQKEERSRRLVASPVARAGPAPAPALSPERLHSVVAFRCIQVPQKTERGRV